MSVWLEAALGRAEAGRAAVVVIEGDSGSGKTALCYHAGRLAEDGGFRVLRVAGVQGEADLALAGLSMLLRPLGPELAG